MIDAAEMIEAVLATGAVARFRASGDSMHPVLRSGDAVDIEPVDPASIRRGDVVLARLSRGLTAHRVVRVTRRDGALRFVTRGDNAPAPDEPFGTAELLGRVRTRRTSPAWFAMRRLLRRLR